MPFPSYLKESATMPKVRNSTGEDRYLVAIGDTVVDGDAVDVSAPVADSLVAQGWARVTKTTTQPATAVSKED